jgi:alpha-tubulin suppressor-like RCC1 family protein
MFSLVQGSRATALASLAFVVAMTACDSATDAGTLGPDFAVKLGATTTTVARGSTTSTYISATRVGGLTSPITYTVYDIPAGLAAQIASTSVPDSAILTITAPATMQEGTYPIVVRGAANGADAHLATIAVTVTATTAAPAPDIGFLAVGSSSCALATDGAAYCWGYNGSGELGTGNIVNDNPNPVAVSGGLKFFTISTSKFGGATCALTFEGAAYCWGSNESGQVGDGTKTQRLVPTRVGGGQLFRSISVGAVHVCAVATNDRAFCWGTSVNGALGNGDLSDLESLQPAPAAEGMRFNSVVAGNEFTCGLTTTADAYCWGLGAFGQLGNGQTTSSPSPVKVAGDLKFETLAAGALAVCGLTTDGKVYCWGNGSFGTLGNGHSITEGNGATRALTPDAVLGGLTFASISGGYQTMCGVTLAGVGYCWGQNQNGTVGDGTDTHRSVPTPVAGGLTFTRIAAGTGASCGITTAKAVFCWGDGSNGGLGDGTTATRLVPGAVKWN